MLLCPPGADDTHLCYQDFVSNSLAQSGQPEMALKATQASLAANPLCVETRLRYAGILWRLGRHKEAQQVASELQAQLHEDDLEDGDVEWVGGAHPSRSRSAARREVCE